eukprot:3071342-Rhodomonas_salina.3
MGVVQNQRQRVAAPVCNGLGSVRAGRSIRYLSTRRLVLPHRAVTPRPEDIDEAQSLVSPHHELRQPRTSHGACAGKQKGLDQADAREEDSVGDDVPLSCALDSVGEEERDRRHHAQDDLHPPGQPRRPPDFA